MAISTKVRRFWRSIPGGTGVNSITMLLKKHSNNDEVGSGSTAGTSVAAGLVSIDTSYLGPMYLTGTNAGTTLYGSNKDVDFIGTISGYDLDVIGLALTSGVVKGQLNEAAVTAAGTDMEVDINTGAFVVQGHPYRNTASQALVVANNGTANGRIDRVVVRHYPKGVTHEGNGELAIIQGTPAASPSAPTPTTDATVWEVSLARIAVAAGASSISNANITDERAYVGPTAAGAVIEALLALKAPLASPTFTGTVTAANLSVSGTVSLPAGSISATDINASVSDTEFGYLDGVTSAIQTQITAKADASATTSALALKANAANPTFTGTVTIPDGALAIADTSGLQTALDGKAALAGAQFTGGVRISDTSVASLWVRTALGVDILYVSPIYPTVEMMNSADFKMWSGAAGVGLVFDIDGATGNITLVGSISANGATITPTELSTLDGIGSTAIVTLLAAKAPLASPTFTGTVTAAAVTATGNVTLGDASADLATVVGRFRSEKSADPTATINTSVGGTGATASVVGTDHAGRVTITVNTANGATTGKIADIDFAQAKPDANYVVILQPRTSLASALDGRVYVASEGTGGWDLQLQTNGGVAMATGSYVWNYWVVEYEN